MTLEEIEARWKAATPGPWAFDVRSGGIASDTADVVYEGDVSTADGTAIAAAPTDIAYLLDLVRKLQRALHDEQQARLADDTDIGKLQRAHAWFVENTEILCRLPGNHCCTPDDICNMGYDHQPGCGYIKARDLKL